MNPLDLLLASARPQRPRDQRGFLSVGRKERSTTFPSFLSHGTLVYLTRWFYLGAAVSISPRLARFQAAPESVQRQFFAELRRRLDKERDDAEWLAEQGVPYEPEHRLIEWDQAWDRRANAARRGQAKLRRNPDAFDLDPDSDPLRQIPAETFVRVLTGEEVPPSGRIRCPFPEHEDRTPSCSVGATTVRCFGCGRSGSIYDLAAAMWDMEPRGRAFVELHKRLRGLFA